MLHICQTGGKTVSLDSTHPLSTLSSDVTQTHPCGQEVTASTGDLFLEGGAGGIQYLPSSCSSCQGKTASVSRVINMTLLMFWKEMQKNV